MTSDWNSMVFKIYGKINILLYSINLRAISYPLRPKTWFSIWAASSPFSESEQSDTSWAYFTYTFAATEI
jgi:hypothetical protein